MRFDIVGTRSQNSSVTTSSGPIDGVPIGSNTPDTGSFTDLSSNTFSLAGQDVNAELQNLADLITAAGISAGDTSFGTFSGVIIPDNATAKAAFEGLEAEAEVVRSLLGIPFPDSSTGVYDRGDVIPDNATFKDALRFLDLQATSVWSTLGIGAGSTNFSSFTGTTLSDNATAAQLFQELETAVEAAGGGGLGAASAITDAGGYFTATDIEGALQELGQQALDLGTFTGTTVSDNADTRTAIQEIETALEALAVGTGNPASLGIGAADADMGTFTGVTITDNATVKVALQELETAVEAANGDWIGLAELI